MSHAHAPTESALLSFTAGANPAEVYAEIQRTRQAIAEHEVLVAENPDDAQLDSILTSLRANLSAIEAEYVQLTKD